jgi:Flp pilus assembly protein TadG
VQRQFLRGLATTARGNAGLAAVEFALLSPMLLLIFAGSIDLGGALYVKFRLDGAVSAGANYALVNAANVGSANGATLAGNIATIVESSASASWANDTVVVNNGPTETVTNGIASPGGTAANADQCYCLTGSPPNWSWGSAATCGSSCGGGGLAGKFVTITATHGFTPLFASYGIVHNGAITGSAVVQTQ